MKRLLILLPLILQACGRPSTGGTVAAQMATSDQILARLKDPFEAAPGAPFAADGPAQPFAGGHAGAEGTEGNDGREAYYTRGFVLNLETLDVAALAARAQAIQPGLKMDGFRFKTWAEVVDNASRGSTGLDGISTCLALHYADRFSGLGLTLNTRLLAHGPGMRAQAVQLRDGHGANVVHVEAWASASPARAFVSVTYFAHIGTRNHAQTSGGPRWGTR